MAHIMKKKNIDAIGIIKHNNRQNEHYGNEDIDKTKSHLNTYFISRDYEYYKNRLKNDLYVYGGWNDKNKAKYNSICSIVVHCPEGFEDEEKFYKAIHEIFKKRYGEENIICSVVHNDEKRSHLHFTFIPCIWHEKKKKYQLSYEKCMAHRFDSFHSDLEKELKEQYDIDVKLADKENNDKFYIDNIKDYKEMKDAVKSLTEKVSNLETQNQFLENTNQILKEDYVILNEENIKIIDEYEKLKNQNQFLKNEISKQETLLKSIFEKIKKCIDILKKAEKKDLEFCGYSPISHDLNELHKEVVENMR